MLARIQALSVAASLGLALTGSARAQTTLSTQVGDDTEGLGATTAVLGDLDGDGTRDVAVASTYHKPFFPAGGTVGRVQILSGASLVTGSPTVLHDIGGPSSMAGCAGTGGNSNFGESIAGNMDIDGDGVTDFVISAPLSGLVIPYSGATGQPLLSGGANLNGSCLRRHGSSVRLLDADGDAYADVLVTEPTTSLVFRARYVVYRGAWIRNGSGAKELYSRASTELRDLLGRSATILGDIDGDGRDDYALSSIGGSMSAFPDGSAVVISGATGNVLNRFGPTAGDGAYGHPVTAASDWNGDGINDLAVTHQAWPSGSQQEGRIEIVSGSWMASGGAGQRSIGFLTLPSAVSTTRLGETLASGDVNGDGHADILASHRGAVTVEWTVFSGRTGDPMWSIDSAMPTSSLYRPHASILEDGEDSRALLGTLDVPTGGVGRGGRFIATLAHDGAGAQATFGIHCPCGVDQPMAGCSNFTGSGAALAVEAGSASLAAQDLTLVTTGMPPFSFGLMIGGVPSTPLPIGAGFLGLDNPIRGAVQQSNGAGVTVTDGDVFGAFAATSATIPGTLAPMIGVPFAMQMIYRDLACTGTTNLSNSYIVVPRL